MSVPARWRPTAVVCAIGLAMAAAGGCSSGKTSGGAGAPGTGAPGVGVTSAATADSTSSVDVCGLLPAAQISTLTGASYTKSSPRDNGCLYTGDGGEVSVLLKPGSGDAAWQATLALTQSDEGQTPVPVSGVGDRAAGASEEFDAQSGNWIVVVFGADEGSTGNDFPHSVAIAKALLAQLH